jgi:hypothetical protein
VVKAISLILSLDEYLQRTNQSNERSTVSGQRRCGPLLRF